jgi:hypothetical protein
MGGPDIEGATSGMKQSWVGVIAASAFGLSSAPSFASTIYAPMTLTPVIEGISEGYRGGSSSENFSLGVGVLAGLPLGNQVRLELGGTYHRGAEEVPSLQVPLYVRVSVSRTFSVGLGPFFSFPLDDVDPERGLTTDFGVSTGLGFLIPLSEKTGIRIDGRYLYGTKNLAVDKAESLKTSAFQALVGLELR